MARSEQYIQGQRAAIKWAINWLHERAKSMRDGKALMILNAAANDLGIEKRDGIALAAQQDGAGSLPHKESIAREIRRAMLDNPTDASFNARAQKREEIADATADVILGLFRRDEQ